MTTNTSKPHSIDTSTIAPGAAALPVPRRRRLWQLPAPSHELLLAMSFTPELLRREVARTLGRMSCGECVLIGSNADVLYSVVHDVVSRNPLSEALQKRLTEVHAVTVRRMAAMHNAEALKAAWAQALDDDNMAGGLWALLTHPLGAALETAAVYDARAWVFAHGRRSLAVCQAQQQTHARASEMQRQADDLRNRLDAQQRQAADALYQAQTEIARLRGELARQQRPSGDHPLAVAPRQPAELPRRLPSPKVGLTPSARPALPTAPSRNQLQPEATRVPTGQPIRLEGRRVLCVGGMQHAVARYRGRIETLGGQFEHHDGGLEDSLKNLEGRLSRADLVICQAACINHQAYHRIKRHCERTGTPCVYLDRPSLARLDLALAQPTREHHALR